MSRKRSRVTLLTAFSFIVLAVTGVLAFMLPFSIKIVGLHALIGFVFIGLVAFHVLNNKGQMSRYLGTPQAAGTLVVVLFLSVLFFLQPAPVKRILGLSGNLGPALERFELSENGMQFHYVPDLGYKMHLDIRMGSGFDAAKPPYFAIWLENASEYHIETLHSSEVKQGGDGILPYWDFKRRGWEKAKRESEASGKDLAEELGVDTISGATQNSSFDPADYILPGNSGESLPYRLLVEIDQPDDDQASLVYAVDIDNASARTFQLLDLVGYPKQELDNGGEEKWTLYYVDGSFSSALKLIDSALLTIERGE